MAWSFDGKWIASAESETVVARDATTGESIKSFPTPAKTQPSSVAVDRDSKHIAVVCFDSSVLVWEMKSGKPVAKFNVGAAGAGSVCFSPDGKSLAAGAHSVVRIFKLPDTRQ